MRHGLGGGCGWFLFSFSFYPPGCNRESLEVADPVRETSDEAEAHPWGGVLVLVVVLR